MSEANHPERINTPEGMNTPEGINTGNRQLVQTVIAGFCPIFMVVESTIQGLATGALIALTVLTSMVLIGCARQWIDPDVRMLFVTIICATLAAILALLLAAHCYGLYLIIGVYLPLVALNCFTLARKQTGCFGNGLMALLKDGAIMTTAVIAVFGVFGLVRELFLHASVFKQFDFDLGQFKPDTGLVLFDHFNGVMLFANGAGTLLILATLMAAANLIRGPGETES